MDLHTLYDEICYYIDVYGTEYIYSAGHVVCSVLKDWVQSIISILCVGMR